MNTDITKQMEMVLYRTEDDNVTVSALIKDETIWITQKAMAELFGVQTPAISKHLKNIFEQGELREEVVVSKMEIPTPHGAIPGKTQLSPTNYYNLDAIISVGYRVNSIQATRFRIWATSILKEYMIKGFAMDDERLKQGKTAFGKDYLDSDTAYHFYATIQNKFHYAITGKTAAEIVYNQADHTKENMGLTTWKNAPDGRILKSDTPIAKNYLDEKQIRQLERAVTGYFDYIEDLIERENVFTMEEFSKSVNEFLEFRRYDILKDNGRISHKQAVAKAYQEYDIFNKTQPIESDFDRMVKGLSKTEK
ncbi:MAG: RhuM family protein [Lachnospiraceae bacterium]